MEKIVFNTTYHHYLADTLTPVGIYLSLRDKFKYAALLESSDYHGDEHQYSYIGIDKLGGFSIQDGQFIADIPNQAYTKPIQGNSLPETLKIYLDSFSFTPDKKYRFIQHGLFGYQAYDMVRIWEDIQLKKAPPAIPLCQYYFYRYVLAFNHFNHELIIVKNEIPGEPEGIHPDEIFKWINHRNFETGDFHKVGDKTSNLTNGEYMDMVRQGIYHCKRGDVFQIVLSRMFKQHFEGDDFNVYRALRSINPSPYLFYFDFGDFKLIGSSPEAQLIIRNGKVTIHPIAGTFKRSGDDEKDLELAKLLLADLKENSEHVMLVDLARNDLSKHGKKTTLEVFKEVQFFSHVIHLVSKVTAQIDESVDKIRIIGDTFPAGTLSGAPKYRAMQLIDDIEQDTRGYYGGAIGHLDFNGDFNHAIMIRTFLSKKDELFYQAGAGVVVDSSPESEMQEVENKLMALNKAIEMAEKI